MKHPFKSILKTQRTRRLTGLSFLALGLGTLLSPFFVSDRAPRKSESASVAKAHVAETYGKLPMMFQANAGQTDERVKFIAQGPGYSLFLTPTGSVFVMSRRDHKSTETASSESRAVLRMNLVGANAKAAVTGVDELAGKVNYFIGNDPNQWHSNVATYGRVRYSEVYPGVDLIYYGNQQQLEYDFVVAPGADCGHISLAFEGAEKVEVEETSGDLLLDTPLGVLRQHQPKVYQEVDGARRMVSGRYVRRAGGLIGFEVAGYDATKRLVIDPTLVYSTYLGGSGAAQGSTIGGDSSEDIAVDASGNAYVTGSTNSPDFPITSGAFQTTYPGSYCTYVTKLNPSGTALVYSTYLAGATALSIAVDASGNAYITGVANEASFPTTPGAFQSTNHGGSLGNAFITKLNPSGTALVYSTYLGGTGDSDRSRIPGGDVGTGIAVDPSGNACVAGTTYSKDFPVTPGAFQTTNKANNPLNRRTVFVTRLNPTGTALVYSTYLGGTDHDYASRIAVDASGNAYVTGATDSTDFPTTAGAFQTTFPGFRSAFATKFSPNGALVYSTYLGGSAFAGTDGRAIAVDVSGNAYLAGRTQSTNYPTTFGSFRKNYCGGFSDAYVTKLNASGSALVYSTYLCGPNFQGGDNADDAFGIAVDSAGNAYVTGYTDSDTFPTTVDAYQTKRAGLEDAFLTKINPSGSALVYSTFLGGAKFDDVFAGIAVDHAGHAYIVGVTESTDFPITLGAFQTTYHGGNDVFVTKFTFAEGQLLNISTRMRVLTGNQVLIGGFIITGTQPKKVIIRGLGPSLGGSIAGVLANPTLELHQGNKTLVTNDNWKTRADGSSQQTEIEATTIPPTNDLESAIVATLNPGSYTAILAGKNGGTGVGLVEVYDLAQAAKSKLANISTRGFVDRGDNVMIGGFIVGGTSDGGARVIVRALGPSLASQGVSPVLANPTLELHDANGGTIATNDNWKDTQRTEIEATTIPPSNDLESAIVRSLSQGAYTVIVRGAGNTTGVGLVEVYNLQ